MNKRVLILLLVTIEINIVPVFAGDFKTIKINDLRVEPPTKMDHKSKQIKNLSSSLDRLYKLYAEKKEYRQFARQSDLQLVEDRVVVTVLTKPGITTANIDGNNLRAFGSRIQAKANHSMRVEIPISELENVATSIKDFAEIIPPMRPKEHAVTSEGVALMNADHWHSVGDSGSGVKVAVIDGGFTSLINAQTEGDIPSSYASHDFTGTGLQTGTPHGTAVAEAIFDLVPNAEFYLYKIADVTDFENAKDTCISNGVDIVNHSMGWFNTGGYYDGTGFICNIVNNALSNGILWVNSAGNSAEDHYRSIFADDGSGYHAFGSGNVNPIGPDPTHVWLHDPGETIIITLNWDDYIYSNQDYDLYLARYDTIPTPHWSIVASSTDRQTGSSYPEETIVYTNPYANGMYGVAVKEYSTSDDWDFTLFDLSRSFGYHTNSSSLTDPGTITDVVTVGAINRINYTSGPQETFSSQGPTTDGRTKPDVAAPDNCNSYAYGYWSGTSLSSPHTVGVCALIKSRFPGYNNSEIRDYLYTNCTVDLGTLGKDNIYGWGKIEMPDIALTVTSPNGGEDFEVDSIHDVTWISTGTSGGVRIEYSTNNGSSWSDIIAVIPDTGAYPWTIPDTPSDSCLLRITDTIGSPSDTCDAIFTISPIPYITVTSPNGGEDFEVDSIHDVTWISTGTSGGVRIEYSTNNGSNWSNVIAGIPDTGAYLWTIPDTPSDSCLLRITDTFGSPSDTSDAIFKISPIPFITVISPNGGEDFEVDSVHNVTWTSSGTSGGVLIQYSIDSGSSWSDVIAKIPDTGVYPWTIPNKPSDSCLIRIADTNGSLADTSDSIFKISPIPYITITAPNGGEDWGRSYSYYITWTSTGTSRGVRIEYSINNGSSWSDVIASIPDTGAYPWTIPTDTISDSCLVRISDTTGSPADTSDSLFAIVSVTSIPIPKLPEVYSFNIKGITAGNQFDIKYALPEKAKLNLEVYDIKGTKIKEFSEEKPAGFYSGKIDMSGKPAGVYFVRMEANKKKFTKINKVVLVK